MTEVAFLADAGKDAGFGHLSRSGAVAVGLRALGIDVSSYAVGETEKLVRDGICWQPVGSADPDRLADVTVVVVDSYRITPSELGPSSTRALVCMHDRGELPESAALVVSTGADPAKASDGWLVGPDYACLRPPFWGLPRRKLRDRVERLLVTTGSGDPENIGAELATRAQRMLPGVAVKLVRGPYARITPPIGVDIVDAPDDLLAELAEADIAITAGGQTMLEAAAVGTPCLVLQLAANQHAQATRLAGMGAVRIFDPPDPGRLPGALSEIASSLELRADLSRRAQATVDGFGALRVANRIAALWRDQAR